MDYYGFPTGVSRYPTPQPVYQWNNYYPESNNIIYPYTYEINQYNEYDQYDPYNQGQLTHENHHQKYYNINQQRKKKINNKGNNVYYENYGGNNYNFNYQNYNDNNYEQNLNNWGNPIPDYSSQGYSYETYMTVGKDGKLKLNNNMQKKPPQTNINKNAFHEFPLNKKQNPNKKYTTENYFDANTQKYINNKHYINAPNLNYDFDNLLNTNTNNNNIEFTNVKKESNDANINYENNYENIFSNPTDNKKQTFPISNSPNDTTNKINYNIENAGYPSSDQNDIIKQIDSVVENVNHSNNINNQNADYPSNQSDNINNQLGGHPSQQDNNINNNIIDNNTGSGGGFSSKPYETTNINNNTENKDNNITKTDNNNPGTQKPIPPMPPIPIYVLSNTYYFHKTGLYNIGSTCYMNATLQCLLHVSPLVAYFIEIYLKQKHYEKLLKINESAPTKGKISQAFLGIIRAIGQKGNKKIDNNSMGTKTTVYKKSQAVSPENFQKTVGTFNPQFRNLEANDSKDLILYLLQVMHQELNYWTNNQAFNGYPDQYNRVNTFQAFVFSYDATNKSIISDLFYGTSENTTKCDVCNKIIYNCQKFEFLTFGVCKYNQKEFNLYNGFDDYIKVDQLTGDNQYYCNNCKKLCDAKIRTTILIPPNYLLINIDYGKNKKYMPSSINYDEEIDISKYVSLPNQGNKYKIIGICSHLGDSGMYGHYVAYCKNKKDNKWYQFNDSFVSDANFEIIKTTGGTPYLLLYERIF